MGFKKKQKILSAGDEKLQNKTNDELYLTLCATTGRSEMHVRVTNPQTSTANRLHNAHCEEGIRK
jgi:hypothetical protein